MVGPAACVRRGDPSPTPASTPVGFPPVVAPGARLLILGSMPGEASLRAAEYYAHPRNAFWPIMGELVGAGPGLAYPDRLRALTTARIALWDVLQSCARSGSLDSTIRDERANDMASFFMLHAGISRLYFNGAKAEQAFTRHVRPTLRTDRPTVRRLPSTSPANAGVSLQTKLEAWRVILDDL